MISSIMELNKTEMEKIDGAETIRVGVTGDLPSIDFSVEVEV